jgi:hypothetical protein
MDNEKMKWSSKEHEWLLDKGMLLEEKNILRREKDVRA